MANKREWHGRVMAWRRGGQTADEFCRGEAYSAGLLRHWAWRLGLTRPRRKTMTPPVAMAAPRLARVVRVKARPSVVLEPLGAIRIEIGRARVEVSAGADEAALAMVLRALESVASAETKEQL